MSARLEVPFTRYQGVVKPEWIDLNGHMNLAYYIVLFDEAFDLLLAEWDLDWEYTKRTGLGLFAVEAHTLYEQELLEGETVRVHSWVIEMDAKRLHVAHEMYRASDMQRAACSESMNLHVDLNTRKVTPWPEAQRRALEAAAMAHRGAAPDWVGRRVSMRRQTAT
ncbi:MAG: thioesterase family protein [Proteobacteria bacterium]|nr:thioesterase family protein [Pseudomonadota bacterium]